MSHDEQGGKPEERPLSFLSGVEAPREREPVLDIAPIQMPTPQRSRPAPEAEPKPAPARTPAAGRARGRPAAGAAGALERICASVEELADAAREQQRQVDALRRALSQLP